MKPKTVAAKLKTLPELTPQDLATITEKGPEFVRTHYPLTESVKRVVQLLLEV